MISKKDLTKTIFDVIQKTVAEKGGQVALTIDKNIDGGLGLDSLDWAAIIVRLEEETGIDPFQTGVEQELRTVSDLVDLYLLQWQIRYGSV